MGFWVSFWIFYDYLMGFTGTYWDWYGLFLRFNGILIATLVQIAPRTMVKLRVNMSLWALEISL